MEEPKETENFRPKTPGPSYKHWVFAVYERTLLVTGKTRGNQSRKDSFSSMLYFIKTKNFNSCNEESCINMLLLLLSRFSRVRLCATPQTAAHQALLSLGFSRQEHWSRLPFPSPMASLVAQNLPRFRSPRFDPWVRKIPWKREWQSTTVFLPGGFHGQSSLAGYSPWGHKK